MCETLTIGVTGVSVVFMVIAVYMLVLTFTSHTVNFISAIVFKVIPFILGLLSLLIALKMLGIF
jgi:hypothetical protein